MGLSRKEQEALGRMYDSIDPKQPKAEFKNAHSTWKAVANEAFAELRSTKLMLKQVLHVLLHGSEATKEELLKYDPKLANKPAPGDVDYHDVALKMAHAAKE